MNIIIESSIRALLQGVMGVLVAKGVVDVQTGQAFVEAAVTFGAAAVVGVGSLMWSVISKKKALAQQPPL